MDLNKSKLKDKQQQKQKTMDVINMNTNNNINNSTNCSIGKATNTTGTGNVNANVGGTSSSSPNKPKEKRRSNEKRKEKSRDAARCRRSRETEIFAELANVLPLRREDVDQLDKASIMRLSIAFLKVREMLKLFPKLKDIKIEETQDENNSDKNQKIFDILDGPKSNKLLTQSMDGFLIILSSEGDVTYVSENISEYLGISQVDILGQQIWEYSHQCDHDELKEALNMRRNNVLSNDLSKSDNGHSIKSESKENNNEKNDEKNKSNMKNIINENLITDHRDFYIRLKCTLTSRGRSVNIKSASYKVIHMTGHIVMNNDGERILVAIGRPLPHPSNIEIPLGSTTFLTKHSLDMKFTYADDNMLSLLGYKPEDLLDKSLYDYHYAVDSESLMATFKSVLSKGQGETNRYRFLGKYGGYSWVVTQATIVYDKQKPQSVVCVNYAISNLENDNEIYSCEQLEASNNKKKTTIETATTKLIQQQQQQQQQQKKLEDKQFDRILEQKKSVHCELLSTGKSAQNNNNFKLSPTAITTNIVIKSPIKLTSDITDNLNENKLLIQAKLGKCCYQQQQQKQPQTQTQQQIYLKQEQQQHLLESNKTRILQTLPNIDNNNKSDLIKCEYNQSSNNQIYRESSLSPIRHTFNKCSINSPTSTLRGDNIQHQLQQQKPITQRGGPKTVTATVFKKVSIPPTKLNFSSAAIIGGGGGTGSGILNRPQSVTASVLTPISSLSKAKQNLTKFPFNNCDKTQQQQQQRQQQINHNQLQHQQLRTEDMNKGFSMFLDDPPELTMLKEEPDDLTNLAPTAGDTCLPLDDSTPLFGEMLDSLILPDTYGTLLSDDINSLDSQQSTNNSNNNNTNNNNLNCNTTNNNNISSNGNNNSLNNKSHIDPFINYRDESSDTTGSPHLLSPGASKSPEVSSIPSLCSPNSLSQDDEFAFMTMNDEIDLTMRAPYIPMNEQEDLPLLTEDLMWSAFSEELHKDIKEALQIEIKNNINNNINNNNMNLNISCNSINSSNNNISCINNNNNINNHNNNNIESNNETSSLAALLCNGVNQNATTTTALNLNSILNQQHQQQHQQSQLQQNTRTSSSSPSSLPVSSLLGQITSNNELSKKRKYELTSDDDDDNDNVTNDGITTTVPSADLVDTIDAFGQVFNNKNSPNIDCWTINDLLQISPLSSGSTTATTISGTTFNNQNSSGLDIKPQHQHQQNIIVNTATIPCTTTATATFHVPLITFQHNGNKINLTRSSSIGSINGCNTTKNGIGIGINIDDQLQQQQCNNKKSNIKKMLTATNNNNNNSQLLNKSSNININITTGGSNSSNGGGNEMTTVTLPQQITTGNSYNNKRHLNISTSLDSKRVKNSSSVEIQTSPTLLQQLMAPTLQKHKGKSISDKSQNSRWNSEGGGGSGGGSDDSGNTDNGSNNVNGQQQQQNIGNNNNNMSLSSSSPSNSVLKNLLVSGCDGVFSSNQQQQKQHLQSADDVMMIDDNSLDSMNDSYQHLKLTQKSNMNNCTKPLQCKISNPNLTLDEISMLSDNNLLHYCGSNPMIGGGPGLLPSPPISILLDSSTENKNKNNVQVTTNSGDNFNLSVDGSGDGGGIGVVGGNRQNYRDETNYRVLNNSPSNYMMKIHSPKLMAFNDSDSDSGIECGGGGGCSGIGISRSNNFCRNFLTRSSNNTNKMTSKLIQESPTKNQMKMTNLQPKIDCDLHNDDSMSLSGDEAPPPLEPTDFILESSAILTSAILSPSPTASCLSSPKLMTTDNEMTTTAINKITIPLNHNDNNNTDMKLSPNSPYSSTFNVDTAVNPLANSSFLMDLCSDDYAMSDLLQDNEITKVLNDWNTEMT